MDNRINALLWATFIIAAAWLAKANGVTDATAFGIVTALVGAAIVSIYGRKSCASRCA